MHGDEYVGISAFVNKSDSGQERNALMLAIGALVPLSKGLLGRSWKHAGKLKDLAQYVTTGIIEARYIPTRQEQGTTSRPQEDRVFGGILGGKPYIRRRRSGGI